MGRLTIARTIFAQMGSVDICEGEGRHQSAGAGTNFLARPAVSLWLVALGPHSGRASESGAVIRRSSARLILRQLHPLVSPDPAGVRSVLPGARPWPRRWKVSDKLPGLWLARRKASSAGVAEARGPLGLRRWWSLWIVGRWPSFPFRHQGGAAPREPPFAGVSVESGPSTWGPYAAACQRPRGRFLPGSPACGPDLKGSVGAIGWSQRPAVRRGCRWWPGAFVAPLPA